MSEVKVVAKIIRNLKLIIKLLRALRFLRKDDFPDRVQSDNWTEDTPKNLAFFFLEKDNVLKN